MARTPIGNVTGAAGNYPKRFDKREKKLLEAATKNTNVELLFRQQPIWSAVKQNGATAAVLGTAPVAGDALQAVCEGVHLENHVAVVAGTVPYLWLYSSANGLEVPLSAGNATNGLIGREITNGILTTSANAFTVGSFLANKVFFEAKVKIQDISHLGQMFVGFRKAEAYRADPDDYDELAAFHVGETGATVPDGRINLAKILNNAATSYTNSTMTAWADAGEHRLRVEVDNAGVVKFFYDGAEPTVTVAHTFDAGEVIVPFLFAETVSASTNGDPGVSVTHWKCGYV